MKENIFIILLITILIIVIGYVIYLFIHEFRDKYISINTKGKKSNIPEYRNPPPPPPSKTEKEFNTMRDLLYNAEDWHEKGEKSLCNLNFNSLIIRIQKFKLENTIENTN